MHHFTTLLPVEWIHWTIKWYAWEWVDYAVPGIVATMAEPIRKTSWHAAQQRLLIHTLLSHCGLYPWSKRAELVCANWFSLLKKGQVGLIHQTSLNNPRIWHKCHLHHTISRRDWCEMMRGKFVCLVILTEEQSLLLRKLDGNLYLEKIIIACKTR